MNKKIITPIAVTGALAIAAVSTYVALAAPSDSSSATPLKDSAVAVEAKGIIQIDTNNDGIVDAKGDMDEIKAVTGMIAEQVDTNTNQLGGETYDPVSSYVKGDIVIYNNRLYECISDTSITGDWDESSWTPTDITKLLKTVTESAAEANKHKITSTVVNRTLCNGDVVDTTTVLITVNP